MPGRMVGRDGPWVGGEGRVKEGVEAGIRLSLKDAGWLLVGAVVSCDAAVVRVCYFS